jgi:uncharacterized membrane protein YccC
VHEFADDMARDRLAAAEPPEADRRLARSVADVLRDVAGLEASHGPDPRVLERERATHLEAVGASLARAVEAGEKPPAVARDLDRAFRTRVLSYAALSAAASAMSADGKGVDDAGYFVAPIAPAPGLGDARRRLAVLFAGRLRLESVWFQAGVRAAVALGLAVLVAGLAELAHAFWVALAVLAVLKSNAVGTSHTAWQALVGTLGGFAVAVAFLFAGGDNEAALWAALPFSVFLAVYTPNAVHFVLGQAMFTVTVVVLFNLIEPEGWRTGLARIEDIAIGCATALLVGLLLWPFGARGQLRTTFASVLVSIGAYAGAAGRSVVGRGAAGEAAAAGSRARASSLRASDAFATYLNEHGPKRLPPDVWARILTGGEELRFVGDVLSAVVRTRGPVTEFPAAAETLDLAAAELERAVVGAGRSLADGVPAVEGGAPPAHRSAAIVDACLPALGRPPSARAVDGVLVLVWTDSLIEYGRRVLDRLADPLAQARAARPWWR